MGLILGTCKQRSLFALITPSLGSLGGIPSPALTPWVVWGKLIPSCSCLGSEPSSQSPDPSMDTDPAAEEESASHCLWVDKFMPRRYMELLSDDVRCWDKWGLGMDGVGTSVTLVNAMGSGIAFGSTVWGAVSVLALPGSSPESLRGWDGKLSLEAVDVVTKETMGCDQNEMKKIGRTLARNCCLF